MPGAAVTVLRREPAAEAVHIRVGKREEVSLGTAAAAKILVESTTHSAAPRSDRAGRLSMPGSSQR
jgi:hypothetical protein